MLQIKKSFKNKFRKIPSKLFVSNIPNSAEIEVKSPKPTKKSKKRFFKKIKKKISFEASEPTRYPNTNPKSKAGGNLRKRKRNVNKTFPKY